MSIIYIYVLTNDLHSALMTRFKPLTIAPLFCIFAVFAEDTSPPEAEDRSVETITVVGTRSESNLEDVALTISVLEKAQIEGELARNIADLVRYEPGVSVGGSGSRFGLTDFTIRGMGGNRVLTLIDGIRVPDEFSFGPFLSSRRDFVDIDSLQHVEIARGPISSLWGSDALGGVVAFQTLQPQSYLTDGKNFHTGLKFGYNGADNGNSNALTLAGGNQSFAGLLRYTLRSASETSNTGSTDSTGSQREKPDPQSIDSSNVVLKGALSLNEANQITFTFDQFSSDIDSQILSDYGLSVFGTTVDTRDAKDTRKRDRISLNYRYVGSSALADRLTAGIYHQTSHSEQHTFENRTTRTRQSQTRNRDSRFDQSVRGYFAQASKSISVSSSEHTLTYGFDYSFTESKNLRDGGTFDSNGVPQFEFSALPTRDFPTTDVTQYALFIQDEIELFDDRLILTPSIRFDRFSASAVADEIYRNGNRGQGEPADYEASETAGKLAGVLSITPTVSLYGHYSQGFRAPPFDDVNVGFTNLLGGYKTISNTQLSSETSTGIEFGVRLAHEFDFIQIALYKNDYNDFIESFALAPAFAAQRGIDPADGLMTFQSINRDTVVIDGVEMSAKASLSRFGKRLENWSLRAALASATGDDVSANQPLNTVDPLNGVLGLAYTSGSQRWGSELILTAAQSKDEEDIADGSARYPSSGYGTLDLLFNIQPIDRMMVNVGLFNLTDKQYIRWIDTVSIGTDAPLRFTQPGFNAAVSLRIDF